MNEEEEIWKDIEIDGYVFNGKYKVSNKARVKMMWSPKYSRNFPKEGRIVNQTFTKHDHYLKVSLHDLNGRVKSATIHRLVAKAFIPNPENKPEVDHINTIRTDNRIDNLRWVTRQENNSSPLTRLHNSQSQKRIRSTKEFKEYIAQFRKTVKVNVYSLDGDFISCEKSIREASRKFGVNEKQISNCCNRLYRKCHNYKFRFA